MNYFAHGRQHVDRPYFLAGTALPDWLSVIDRRARVRGRAVMPHLDSDDRLLAELAGGVAQHLADDAWFHASPAFAVTSERLGRLTREAAGQGDDDSIRGWFLGHVLAEVLLDAALIEAEPRRLEWYYEAVGELDGVGVGARVDQLANRPVGDLSGWIEKFMAERFLWDYLEDARLTRRLNQVLRRVGLAELPAEFAECLPEARRLVRESAGELLAGG